MVLHNEASHGPQANREEPSDGALGGIVGVAPELRPGVGNVQGQLFEEIAGGGFLPFARGARPAMVTPDGIGALGTIGGRMARQRLQLVQTLTQASRGHRLPQLLDAPPLGFLKMRRAQPMADRFDDPLRAALFITDTGRRAPLQSKARYATFCA